MSRGAIIRLLACAAVPLCWFVATGCTPDDPGPMPPSGSTSPAPQPEVRGGLPEPVSPPPDHPAHSFSRVGRDLVGHERVTAVTGSMRPGRTYVFDAPASAAPVIWGDLLVVGTALGSVHGVASGSGEPRWSVDVPSAVSALAVDEQAVYVADRSRISRVDPRSGAVEWTLGTASPIVTALTAREGSLYAGLAGSEVIAVSAADGRLLWSASVRDRPVDRIAAGYGTVCVVGEGGMLVSLDAATGEARWEHGIDQATIAAATMGADRVVAVGVEGTVVIRGEDGGEDEGDRGWTVDAAPVLVSPIEHGEKVVLADGAGRIHAYSRDGRPLWTFDLPLHLAGVPARIGDVLIVGDAGGGLFAIDLNEAAEISRLSLRSAISGEAAFWDGRLFWALRDGTVRSIRVDEAPYEVPRLTADQTWVIPEGGTFELADDEVTLSMRARRDATFEISVTSSPPQPLSIRVEREEGRLIASSSPQTWGARVLVVLDAGFSYRLIVARGAPGRRSTVTLEIEQLR